MIPSKKVLALILISISLVTGAFIFAEKQNKIAATSIYTAQDQTTNLVAGTIDTYKDSDGDGLKDWEETLWGTDPKVADADKVEKQKTPAPKKAEEPLTSTDKLARSFFSQYMNLKEVGLQNDKDTQENLAKTLVEATESAELPKPYTVDDIKISSTISVRDYGNNFGALFKENSGGKNEAGILRDALTTESKAKLKELDPMLAGHKRLRAGLLNMQVPPQAATAHIDFLNALNKLVFVVELYTKAFTDPVASIQGLALYPEIYAEIIYSLASVKSVFTSANIVFTSTEPGSFLGTQ